MYTHFVLCMADHIGEPTVRNESDVPLQSMEHPTHVVQMGHICSYLQIYGLAYIYTTILVCIYIYIYIL